MESDIDSGYLKDLNELYDTFFLPNVQKDQKIGLVLDFDVNEIEAEEVADIAYNKIKEHLESRKLIPNISSN